MKYMYRMYERYMGVKMCKVRGVQEEGCVREGLLYVRGVYD